MCSRIALVVVVGTFREDDFAYMPDIDGDVSTLMDTCPNINNPRTTLIQFSCYGAPLGGECRIQIRFKNDSLC